MTSRIDYAKAADRRHQKEVLGHCNGLRGHWQCPAAPTWGCTDINPDGRRGLTYGFCGTHIRPYRRQAEAYGWYVITEE